MSHLKIFKNFDKKEEIEKLCKKYKIENYIISEDFYINVNSDVHLGARMFEKIPIKFGKVYGEFNCSGNELSSLENSPFYVKDSFLCGYNQLETLISGPASVGGEWYSCHYNNLKDLYGFPENFSNGSLEIDHNPVCEILYLMPGVELLIKFIHLLNYNHVIRNGDTIIQDRLEESLAGVSIDELKKYNFDNYKLI